MAEKLGKYFEGKSLSVLKKLFPGLPAHGEKQIPTTYDGFRKVDIGLNNPGDYDYVIFECKDENRTTGVGAVGQAHDIMKDVAAAKCAVITNNKTSANALKKAIAQDVDIFNVIDPDDNSIRPKLNMRVVSEFTYIESYVYRAIFAGQDIVSDVPPERLELSKDETVHKLVSRLWNEGALDRTQGSHAHLHSDFNMTSAPDFGLISAPADEIEITYTVVTKRFVSSAPLAKGEGLFNVRKKQFLPVSATIGVGPMSIEDIAKAENLTTESPAKLNAAFYGTFTHQM